MDSTRASNEVVPGNTKCVECMCLMTLYQEHISCKHSNSTEIYFELSEWQQAGYKQVLKWTLECDRCDFKTANKTQMFDHIANHQMLENTAQRLNQSAAGYPSAPNQSAAGYPSAPNQSAAGYPSAPKRAKPILASDTEILMYNSAPKVDYHLSEPQTAFQSDMSDSSTHTTPLATASCSTSNPEHDDDSSMVIIKDEYPEPVLIHMEESDIDEINRSQAQQAPPLDISKTRDTENGVSTVKGMLSSPKKNLDYKCKVCNFAGTNIESITYHMRSEHNHFNCHLCSFVGGKGVDLEEHMNKLHQSLLCIYCGVNGGNARALRRHYSLDHRTKEKQCKRCNFKTSSQTILTHHVNQVHHRRKPVPCPYCDYITYSVAAVKQHVLAIHRKEKPFCCPNCPMSFARKFQVKEHLKRRHNVEMSPLLLQSQDNGHRVDGGETSHGSDNGSQPLNIGY